jgi:hypothetical protein
MESKKNVMISDFEEGKFYKRKYEKDCKNYLREKKENSEKVINNYLFFIIFILFRRGRLIF